MASELDASRYGNLYDAARELRPFWFNSARNRGGDGSIAVYIDDQQIGTIAALQRLSVGGVQRIRYLAPTEAEIRFGQLNGRRPAIVVESTRR